MVIELFSRKGSLEDGNSYTQLQQAGLACEVWLSVPVKEYDVLHNLFSTEKWLCSKNSNVVKLY
jgi:hypothetical protein